MRVHIETYGCAASQAESEIMAGILKISGFDIVLNEKDADVIIIQTCLVKQVTEQKILHRIKELKDKKLIITGCMPEVIKDKLESIAPNASLVSTHHIRKIARAVQMVLKNKKVEFIGDSSEIKLCLPRIRKNPVIDIVPISSGCSGACTYCAVKLAKGELFSYPKAKIIQEITESVRTGCKEVWLTSQDNASYGMDKYNESRLPDLINSIRRIPGNFMVRIGMMNPNNIKPILNDLIKAYSSKKIYKFVHIPVQSGNNEILKKMNRKYTIEEFIEIVNAFRQYERFTIWTDIIVGYPGESEEQFRDSMKLVQKCKFDWVNISRFAKREGTVAAKLPQLPTDIMKKRTSKLTNLVNNVALERNKEWIGWEGKILISEKGKRPGQWIGRNFAYKPVVIFKSGNLLGKIIDVKVTDAINTTLVGVHLKK
ncbi:MAG: tRNA (N(6)-L-threonylcarbamoyladenosine(37)-C(2))-methylthiotransferase [Candidatus Aenigmarchaeota archaeon]|nr:tRNA (N(6)-L-threonylcarbamoyladenosine(37)-C(2))-methylthiotransferase [Candidatus Aenigmarchaeota archaeon]